VFLAHPDGSTSATAAWLAESSTAEQTRRASARPALPFAIAGPRCGLLKLPEALLATDPRCRGRPEGEPGVNARLALKRHARCDEVRRRVVLALRGMRIHESRQSERR
jgi:hypothetical protein